METIVNLNEVKRIIEDEKFTQYLLANTSDFCAAAWILQTLLNELKKYEKEDE